MSAGGLRRAVGPARGSRAAEGRCSPSAARRRRGGTLGGRQVVGPGGGAPLRARRSAVASGCRARRARTAAAGRRSGADRGRVVARIRRSAWSPAVDGTAGPSEVEAAIFAIARVHTAFAEHPLLPEFRLWGGDRGSGFYSANVADAVVALRSPDLERPHAIAARDALLEWMNRLKQEEPERTQALAASAVPRRSFTGICGRRTCSSFRTAGDIPRVPHRLGRGSGRTDGVRSFYVSASFRSVAPAMDSGDLPAGRRPAGWVETSHPTKS